MKIPHKALVALVDGERFVLLRNDGQIFEPKLSKVEEPSLDPTNFSAGIRHQDKAGQMKGNTDLNELAHGAAAAEWLNQKAIAGEMDELVVVADPKTLGEMRRHYHSELEKRVVGEVDKALTHEPLDKIEQVLANA
ncbi:host attachment protein [Aurantiacibacter gangjinensis]|uniref:Attachment protein n=1 Tax=Aurantiacibacter gangjinensis TaxID=502682 RepID=A0A0G9MR00_9SPHN|nr:host attachment protein [Aurantiacibacter gangjinensis]APE27736.1 AtsE [Aurantiacibacter gangjinensis]KLE31738.1 attachment protein [Aurantiacibacter gangjinensis]